MFDLTEFNKSQEQIKKVKNEVVEVRLEVGWNVNGEWFDAIDHSLYGKIAKITRDNLYKAANLDTYVVIGDTKYSITNVIPSLDNMTTLTLTPRFPVKIDIEI